MFSEAASDGERRVTPMSLSDAIRLGSSLKPQAFGTLYRRETDLRVPGDVLGLRRLPEATCALGGAFDAGGVPIWEIGGEFVIDVDAFQRFPILGLIARHPVNGFPMRVSSIVMNLNDGERWTRLQIADWVAEVEAKWAAFRAEHAAKFAALVRVSD